MLSLGQSLLMPLGLSFSVQKNDCDEEIKFSFEENSIVRILQERMQFYYEKDRVWWLVKIDESSKIPSTIACFQIELALWLLTVPLFLLVQLKVDVPPIFSTYNYKVTMFIDEDEDVMMRVKLTIASFTQTLQMPQYSAHQSAISINTKAFKTTQ